MRFLLTVFAEVDRTTKGRPVLGQMLRRRAMPPALSAAERAQPDKWPAWDRYLRIAGSAFGCARVGRQCAVYTLHATLHASHFTLHGRLSDGENS